MVEHVNRNGVSFFLHEGRTKTGKPKYFFSKKREGNLVSAIPDGFEIYESPNAQVALRKVQPQLVTPEEVHIVERAARTLASGTNCLVDVKGKSIIVHTADGCGKNSWRIITNLVKIGNVSFG